MALTATAPVKVLIVEDNAMDASLLQVTLNRAHSDPAEFVSTGTLGEARGLLERERFDIVLLDLSLPDSQGLDTFSRLQIHAPETPIILLTGQDDEALGLEAVRAGAQEYVVKGTLNGKILWRVISYAIERNSLRRSLRENEQRYKLLLGAVTDYLYNAKVEEGRVVSTAHGYACVKVTGYLSREFDRDPNLWYRMVHEEDRPLVLHQAEQILAGQARPLEHRLIHKDGSIRWVRHTPVLRMDEMHRVIGYDGLISDITERKQAEEALQNAVADLLQSQEALKTAHLHLMQAEKMEAVGRMAAGIAHEVKNPLQILLTSLDYFSRRLSSEQDKDFDEVLNEMRKAGQRADAIINGLLDFTHTETLDLKTQDINGLIQSALAMVRHNLSFNHVVLQTELATGLPPVALDGLKIEQLFINLFNNAIDAMPHGGALTVKSRIEQLTQTHRDQGSRQPGRFYAGDTVAIVEVEDSGGGIPPEALHKVFEPFFTTKITGKGTGLGLAIAKRTVDLHGGLIEIGNRPQGGAICRLMFNIQK